PEPLEVAAGLVRVIRGYVASGAGFCPSPRVPTNYFDDAVTEGIQKRLDQVLNPPELRHRLVDLLRAEAPAQDPTPAHQARLPAPRRKIARLVDVWQAGHEDLPSVRVALVSLERERAQIEAALTACTVSPVGDVAVAAEELIGSLANVRDVLATGAAEE